MKNYQRHLIYGTIIVLIIFTINVSFFYLENKSFPELKVMLKFLSVSAYFTSVLYLVNLAVSRWAQNFYPGFDWKSITKSLILGSVGSAVVSLICGLILYISLFVFSGNTISESVQTVLNDQPIQRIQFLIWFAVTVSIIFHVGSLIQHYQSEQLKVQKQKVTQISTRHESLKSQISSHFLFNSLNVLNGLIEEDPQKAQDFVESLSTVYRYVLEEKDSEWVSLEREIEFCKTYLELVQKRFEDGLRFEIDENIPADFLIAPLSLQILVENCIKHNRISSEEPLYIKVYFENGFLTVKNNLQIKKQLNPSTGKGLQHILSRYASFKNKKVEINQTNREFIVKIPLLTLNEIKMENQQNYTEQEYRQALARVEEIQGFYWNLASYVAVNALLSFIDIREDGVYDWAYWPLIGWGIGVFFHAINVFGIFNSSNWKNRMIQKELEKRKEERDFLKSNF